MPVKKEIPLKIQLPTGILQSDLKYPDYKSKDKLVPGYDNSSFEIWYTERFGWCIPTLLIRGAGRRYGPSRDTARTYGVTIKDENLNGHQVVTMGSGPHVKAKHTVYVRESRKEALQKFLDIRSGGAEDANSIRDRISTRRARTSLSRGSMYTI
jgi:hypothetical protein